MKSKEIRSEKAANIEIEAALKMMGERIKQLRIKRGYSSYEYFAFDYNISRAQFGRYEKR